MSGQLHPVFNLTSARLVLGNPAEPETVKSAQLDKLPKGQTIGIPGAPYATPVASGSSSDWALCDSVDNPQSVSPSVGISVVAMPLETGASIGPIPEQGALLASYQGREWLVTEKGRHSIDRSDRALTSAVGISVNAKPTPISEGVFNALPDMGPWQLPPIPAAGEPNDLGLPEELVIGSVFQTETHSGPRYHLVTPDGIAPINAITAAALRARESYGLVSPPAVVPSLVVTIPEQNYPSPLPDQPLELLSREEAPTVCWTWQRGAGEQAPETKVLAGRRLPIPASAMNTGIKQIQRSATVYIKGGKFISLASPDPRYGESLYYIDPQGIRYGLPDQQTAGILGLATPSKAPWKIVRLLVDGPVLSQENALLEHDTLRVDSSPRKFAGAG